MKIQKGIAAALVFFVALAVALAPADCAEPKKVILLIGDGMGPQAVGLAIYYNRFLNGMDKRLNIERVMSAGNTGYCLTYQHGTVVTDSASAATALASGVKTRDAMIGQDPDGRPMANLVDLAQQMGKSTGIISDTRLTHATPAAFYASVAHRDREAEIAAQFVARGDVTVAFSGGAEYFVPSGTKVEEHPDLKGIDRKAGWGSSKRKDTRDLVGEAKKKGYTVVSNDKGVAGLDGQGTEKVLGLFSASGFPSAIDRPPQAGTGVPTLSKLTGKALEILNRNPKGFFLMVEGGQVDWVAHGNDVAAVVHEMMEFDKAVGTVLSFLESNPDTLVVVTADHDTGGLTIGYSSHNPPAPVKLASGETWKTKYNFGEPVIFEKMARQKKSFLKMVIDCKGSPAALKKEVEENSAFTLTEEEAMFILAKDPKTGFPVPREYREFYVYANNNPQALMGRLFGKEMSTAWAVGTHTHTPVMVFAQGPQGEKFRGLLDNVDIPRIIAAGWGASLPQPREK
ncbi:MAG TPA: alkaline phosphatase [Thermodesulfobacteriota bacterium]|nr:alkaline phosphatase [Thermodesulfobacteriota bacterium]